MTESTRRKFLHDVSVGLGTVAVARSSPNLASASSPSANALTGAGSTEDAGHSSPQHAANTGAAEGRWIDLAQAQPAEALSKVPRRGHWRAVPWKARYQERAVEGTMLMVGPASTAPEVVIDPQLAGPHELFVGLPTSFGLTSNPVKIKLDNDPCYVRIVCDPAAVGGSHGIQGIQDARFRGVDMTGRRIHIAPCNQDGASAAGVAYIRAVPIPESRLDQNTRKGLRLVALQDGFGNFCLPPPFEESNLWEDILPYRHSGFSALQWCISGADHCNYATKVGTLLGEGLDEFPRIGDRYYYENLKSLFARGIDPVATVIKMCHSIGLECHLAVRLQAWALYPPYDGFFMSRFYAAHPELRCVDRDGRAIARLSYAYAEVREHICDIIDELVRYEPDGINLIICRGYPLVLYEEPFSKEFQSRHGKDPRQLPEDHPDVLALRAEIISNFVQEVRRRTQSVSGKRLEMSAIVLSDEGANRFFGLDVVRWVKERWVDEISPSVYNAQHQYAKIQCAYLAAPCRASGCRLIVNMLPRSIKPAEYIPEAEQYRAQGAQGFSFWDTATEKPVEWALLNAIGHLDDLKNPPSLPPSVLPLTDLGGFVMDRYPSIWGF
jgi:hypothetical protein